MIFPIQVAAGGRYFVDGNNNPELILGDSAWCLFANCLVADAWTYFNDRKGMGFNMVMASIFAGSAIGLGGRSDYSTIDGITPFPGGGQDITQPQAAYFQRCVDIVHAAEAYGIVIALDPVENYGWQTVYQNATAGVLTTFGQYLGTTFSTCPNICWLPGNDYGVNAKNWPIDTQINTLITGIKSRDSHIWIGIELDYNNSCGFDNPNFNALDANTVYTYFPSYAEAFIAYNRTTKPAYLVETTYEQETYGNVDSGGPANGSSNAAGNSVVVHQQSWAYTCGALCGYLYGSWKTQNINQVSIPWKNLIQTPIALAAKYLVTLLRARHWWLCSPDTGHTFCTNQTGVQYSDPGNPSASSSVGTVPADRYTTAMVASDKSFGIAYIPRTDTITLDLRKLNPTITARWMDPYSGVFTTVSGSPFSNGSTHPFTSPGNNSNGSGYTDWILVLDPVSLFNTVTVNLGGTATTVDINVLEYSGATSPALDASSASTGTSTSATTTVVTTNPIDVIIGAGTSTGTLSASSGVTRSSSVRALVQDQGVGTSGSYIVSENIGSSSQWVMQTVALKASSGTVDQTVTNVGRISSLETFGAQKINEDLMGHSILSLETFGVPFVNAPANLTGHGVLTVETFGLQKVDAPANLTGHSILTSETFGIPKVDAPATLGGHGVGTLETFGRPNVDAPAWLFPQGIDTKETFGTMDVSQEGNVNFYGILTGEAFGLGVIDIGLMGHGISSLEAIGNQRVNEGQMVYLDGIQTQETFGTMGTGNFNVDIHSITTEEAIGKVRVSYIYGVAHMGRVL